MSKLQPLKSSKRLRRTIRNEGRERNNNRSTKGVQKFISFIEPWNNGLGVYDHPKMQKVKNRILKSQLS